MTNGEANTPITSGVMRTISVPVVGIADSSNVTGPEAPCTKMLRTEPTAEMLGAIETASETPSGRVVVNAEADEIRLASTANTLTKRKNLLLLLNIMVIIQHLFPIGRSNISQQNIGSAICSLKFPLNLLFKIARPLL